MSDVAGTLDGSQSLNDFGSVVSNVAVQQRHQGDCGPGAATGNNPVLHELQSNFVAFGIGVDHEALVDLNVHLSGAFIINGLNKEAVLEVGTCDHSFQVADAPGAEVHHSSLTGSEDFQSSVLSVNHCVVAHPCQTLCPLVQAFSEVGVISQLGLAAHQLCEQVNVASSLSLGPDVVTHFDVTENSVAECMCPGIDTCVSDLLASSQQFGVGGGFSNAQVVEDLLVVENAPGLEVDGEAVDLAISGNVAQIALRQAQTCDNSVVGQISNIAVLDQVGIQAGVAHHDFGLVAGSQCGLQLGEVVSALVVHNVFPGDVVFGMLSSESSFNCIQTGLLGGLSHVVEDSDLYVLNSRSFFLGSFSSGCISLGSLGSGGRSFGLGAASSQSQSHCQND